ncbi:hypothetical protein BD324DRAFT_636388 [Kockovaella imperatae]|uniref:Uncharacterized protein n=1 Tax=Kockovaella imperatae TaxID=4999 RepID=A0A1Y1UAL9_9TREE|nr:hypothetical protein BD324DRAFT_636388 [Kockovaella imperatae]ORX34557.1 hypothetical protein BD324DRAFT_636388 [Kockovaella imperatae]
MMTTTIDDQDPKLAWYGASCLSGAERIITDDTKSDLYYDAGLPHGLTADMPPSHGSTGNGEYCIIAWHGTDIAGIYGISVDGQDAQFYSGYASSDTFQQVLFATSGLAEGDHTIRLSNENARNTEQYPAYIWFDVDYAVFTGTLMDASSTANVPGPTTSTTPITSSSIATSTSTQQSSSTDAPPSSSTSFDSTPSTSTSASSSTSPSALSGFSLYPSSSRRLNGVGGPTSNQPQTSGTPVVPTTTGQPSSSVSSGSDNQDSGKTSNRTTAIAVSVTIIVVAVVVIATVGILWFLRRKRRRREEQEETNGGT